MWRDDQIPPPCLTQIGCDVGEELASDPGINEFLDRYLESVYLRNLTGINETALPILKELGLLDDTDTLLALELIVRKAQEAQKGKSDDED